MNRSLFTRATGLVIALALTGAPGAAAPPAASSAPPTASGAPPKVPLPVVHGSDIPTTPSAAPSAAEWKGAQRVLPTRGSPRDCELALVREWLRIRCPLALAAGVVAGDTKGVSIHVAGRVFGPMGGPGDLSTTLVMPIQRGQARIVAFNYAVEEYESTALGEGPVLGIVWREGRADPVLTMYGPPKRD